MEKGVQRPKEMGLFQFLERFGTNEKCEEHLFEMRFGDAKFVCPKCGNTHFYRIKTRNLAACTKCNYQVSPLVGSIFENTKLELRKWFLAIYLMTISKSGISSKSLQKEISVTYKTAWYVHKRIAAAMKNADEKYKLDGEITLGEAFFTGREGSKKAGRGINKTKVIVALGLRKNGKPKYLKMKIVGDFKAKTIEKFADENIEKGSKLQTDGFKVYQSKQLKNDYLHDFEVLPADSSDSKLHWIHQIIGNAKHIILGTYHGLRRGDLQTYLDEFCYRFNRRFIPHLMFDKLVNSTFYTPSPRYYSRVVLG